MLSEQQTLGSFKLKTPTDDKYKIGAIELKLSGKIENIVRKEENVFVYLSHNAFKRLLSFGVSVVVR